MTSECTTVSDHLLRSVSQDSDFSRWENDKKTRKIAGQSRGSLEKIAAKWIVQVWSALPSILLLKCIKAKLVDKVNEMIVQYALRSQLKGFIHHLSYK